jgi:hypothetical protein
VQLQLIRHLHEELLHLLCLLVGLRRHQVQLQNALLQLAHSRRKRVLQLVEQIRLQIHPNVAQRLQVALANRLSYLIDDLVDAKAFVLVSLEVGVERFESAAKAAKHHVLAYEVVDELDVRHGAWKETGSIFRP